jgi:hypothetical protein
MVVPRRPPQPNARRPVKELYMTSRCICGAPATIWVGTEPTCALTAEGARQLLASDVRAGRRPWLIQRRSEVGP